MPAEDHPSPSAASTRPAAAAGRVFVEALLVAALAAAFALVANRVSPQGLSLTRDYFPSGTAHEVRPVAGPAPPRISGTNSEPVSPAQYLAAQMKAKGLQLLDERQTLRCFHDPRYQKGVIVFIDARDKDEYRKGHIPGAYDFDPYHPENYFPTVLPVCQKAQQVVVYCNGGDCDDSESAALLLRDVGIPNQKLFVYGGGFTEWKTNNLPVETGGRNSGSLLNTPPPPQAASSLNTNQ